MNSVLIVGSVALDSVETPAGTIQNALGGAATYGAVACSLFSPVQLVGVVGDDFPAQHVDFLQSRAIDLEGLQIVEGGKTFRWKGDYLDDLNQAVTHETALGVFEHFEPHLPESYQNADFVLLANIHPALQLQVLAQVKAPKLVLCDTMNLWINLTRDLVFEVFSKVDIAILNDGEAKMLTDLDNVILAGRALLKSGPQWVIIKKGEHGSLVFHGEEIFSAPSFPVESVVDPTGAGDSFAGALIGFLAAQNTEITTQNIHRAMAHGAAVASATVQGFSLQSLRELQRQEVERRVATMREMSAF